MVFSIYDRYFKHLNVVIFADRVMSNGISVYGDEPHEKVFIQKAWTKNDKGDLRYKEIAHFKFKK